MTKEAIAAKLKELREQAFPSLTDFEKKSGLTQQTFTTWESGQHWPKIDGLDKMLRSLGWTLSAFFAKLEAEERGEKPDPADDLTQKFRAIAVRDPERAAAILLLVSKHEPVSKPPELRPGRTVLKRVKRDGG